MIDVVFLLIIFFLVSSHLAKQENTIPLNLPIAGSGIDETDSLQTVVVNVLPDGSWHIAGANIDQAGLDRILRARSMATAESLQLKIRMDQQVTYDRIEPILRSAAAQGIGNIVFSVFEDRGR